MTIFIHFYILLGFLDLVGHIVIILFTVYCYFKILLITGCLVWYIFCSLSLTTQVLILIRLYLLLYNLSYDNLYYILNATSSQNVMDISSILNTGSSSGGSTTSTGGQNPPPTGGQNPPPTGNTTGVNLQNPTMANIKAKINLQSTECHHNCKSIYYTGYSPAATLTTPEKDLLANTIAEDSSDTRPYGVINRTINHNLVPRVVYDSRGRFERYCRDVLCNGPFREFLEKYP